MSGPTNRMGYECPEVERSRKHKEYPRDERLAQLDAVRPLGAEIGTDLVDCRSEPERQQLPPGSSGDFPDFLPMPQPAGWPTVAQDGGHEAGPTSREAADRLPRNA